MHVQEHKVRVLNKLLHARGEPGTCRTINHPMVRTDAKVDSICLLDSETIRLLIVIDQLRDSMCLSDRNDGSLWAQDGRYKVLASDITDTRNAESSIVKVSLDQTAICSLLRQVFQIVIDLKNALVLDGLDVRNSQAICTVHSDAKIVIVLHHVPLDVTLFI